MFYSVTFEIDCIPHYFKTHGEAYAYAISRCIRTHVELSEDNLHQIHDQDMVDDIFYIETCEFETL